MEFFLLSLPLWFHPTLGVLGVCCSNCASPGPTVCLGCLKNSASRLSCALRKYFLGFMELQSEMPSIVKEVCGAAGGWTLISACLSSTLITWSSPLPHLTFICWSWTSVSNCIFHLFSLHSAYSLRHWRRVEFYILGIFFNTVLLSPLFCLPSYISSRVKSSLFPSTSEMQLSVFMHILAIKSLISVLRFNAVTRFYYFF